MLPFHSQVHWKVAECERSHWTCMYDFRRNFYCSSLLTAVSGATALSRESQGFFPSHFPHCQLEWRGRQKGRDAYEEPMVSRFPHPINWDGRRGGQKSGTSKLRFQDVHCQSTCRWVHSIKERLKNSQRPIRLTSDVKSPSSRFSYIQLCLVMGTRSLCYWFPNHLWFSELQPLPNLSPSFLFVSYAKFNLSTSFKTLKTQLLPISAATTGLAPEFCSCGLLPILYVSTLAFLLAFNTVPQKFYYDTIP